jgi:uncharacterized SAM-binding protein YcdF (DUF218 family)
MVGYACGPTESVEFYGKIAFRVKPDYARLRFLLPLLIALIAIGLLPKTRQRSMRRMGWPGLALLIVRSTPFVGETLPGLVEFRAGEPLAEATAAIVVPGAGTCFNAPEYGGDTVNRFALERLRYAAALHRKSGRPILVSGGRPAGNDVAEAVQMKTRLTPG